MAEDAFTTLKSPFDNYHLPFYQTVLKLSARHTVMSSVQYCPAAPMLSFAESLRPSLQGAVFKTAVQQSKKRTRPKRAAPPAPFLPTVLPIPPAPFLPTVLPTPPAPFSLTLPTQPTGGAGSAGEAREARKIIDINEKDYDTTKSILSNDDIRILKYKRITPTDQDWLDIIDSFNVQITAASLYGKKFRSLFGLIVNATVLQRFAVSIFLKYYFGANNASKYKTEFKKNNPFYYSKATEMTYAAARGYMEKQNMSKFEELKTNFNSFIQALKQQFLEYVPPRK